MDIVETKYLTSLYMMRPKIKIALFPAHRPGEFFFPSDPAANRNIFFLIPSSVTNFAMRVAVYYVRMDVHVIFCFVLCFAFMRVLYYVYSFSRFIITPGCQG